MRSLPHLFACIVFLACCSGQVGRNDPIGAPDIPGQNAPPGTGPAIVERFPVPAGFTRTAFVEHSFGHYLRGLPLKPPGAPVYLHTGELKWNQRAHAAVIDMSVGKRDLQQCADALMRLRAEHLYSSGKQDEITFNFTSGFQADWKRWRNGERIRVNGNACSWTRSGKQDGSHEQLLSYLQQVFTYAGTLSLSKELLDVSTEPMEAGDVFIHGGSPGHAVMVVDVARNAAGEVTFMLAQSYMPAQDIHVLRNLKDAERSPWFTLNATDKLYTPEWTFEWNERKRWP